MAIPRNISLLWENRGIKEWQFNIPRGSWKIKSIPWGPRGPQGISGNDILLNLQVYYKKSQYIYFSYYTIFKNSLRNLKFLDLF